MSGTRPYILLYERNPVTRELLQHHLSKAQCDVDLVRSADDLASVVAGSIHDLHLLDFDGPRSEPEAMIKGVRESEQGAGYKHAPIVAIASSQATDLFEVAEIECLLLKPVKRGMLLDCIERYCRAGEAQEANTCHESWDWARALSEFGDRQILLAIAQDFVLHTREQLGSLYAAIELYQSEVIRKEAHKIKGGAQNLYAGAVAGCAVRLEQMGRSGELEGSREVLHQLHAEIDKLEACVVEIEKSPGGEW